MFPEKILRPIAYRQSLAHIALAIDYLECVRVDTRFGQLSVSATLAGAFLAAGKPAEPATGGHSSQAFSIISLASSIGFSGGRRVSEVGPLSEVVRAACRRVNRTASVFTGCASGVDAIVRSAVPSVQVLRVEDFFQGNYRSAYAMRSSELVRRVGSNGLWVSFPEGNCPEGLQLWKTWKSAHGSGTWGSLALAGGSGLNCLCYSKKPPTSWGFEYIGENWFYRPAGGSENCQLSLF